ncbi:MAG TPA: sigma-70 family RNA polymerase sigma factor [Polyangiales bacterium]|nr:sigma-70 family RNA polymerase sigma factor [Polyangiales bacterium]
MLTGEDEERLIERLRQRDEGAFNQLVRLHQAAVFRQLLRVIGDPAEAEDLAQEVFVTVFKAIETFRGDSRLATWIHRIAQNHARNRLKYHGRHKRRGDTPLEETTEESVAVPETGSRLPRPDHQVEAHQAELQIRLAITQLDAEQRTLIVLRDLENMTYEEIQEQTGLPSGTVKSRLHRARVALQERFRALSEGKP